MTVYDGSSGVGAALDTTTVIRQLEHYMNPGLAPISVSFSGGVWLAPGDYYVGIHAPGEDIGWAFSAAALVPPFATRSISTGNWVYESVGSNLTSRILGDPVPEPASWQMLGCAAAVIGARALVRRRARA
ncbi:MAG: hypothetical protein FJW38_05520 [Acidobacteria bacterium]|nr:hypothetical protein [Acidobacteriota bacterium]